MAVETLLSVQLAEGYRKYPIDDHGKLRFQYANAVQAVAGDDGSFVHLFKLPPGRKRILPHLSKYKVSALGASRVMKVGHGAYRANVLAAGVAAVDEPADDDAFMVSIDVSSATNAAWTATSMKFDIYSMNEVLIYLTITGGAIDVGETFEFLMAYLYE